MKKVLSVLIIAIIALSSCFSTYAAIEPGTYDRSLLVNWTDEAFMEHYGVHARDFTPADPQPLTYIAMCMPVINPLTGQESEGGLSYYHRTVPASKESVLERVSDLSQFSLTLTDDPDQATFLAVFEYTYSHLGDFSYNDKNAIIPMYTGILTVTLYNMITGENASATRNCWVFPETSIERSVLDEGIGKQFFAMPVQLNSKEITSFNDLLGLNIDDMYDYQDDENGGVCITKYLGGDVTELKIPENINGRPVTGIGEKAFERIYFTYVRLPDSLTHIDKEAFDACFYLEAVELPDSLTSIGESAFNNTALREIYIPDSVTELGNGVFSNCSDLNSVRLPSGLKKVPDSAFFSSGIASVDLPDTVTEIGRDAFNSCDNLKSVYLPENVSIIGDSAFEWCSSLTDVTCAGEIGLLDNSAFASCGQLSSVIFQKGVKAVGDYAFRACSSLQTIDLYGAQSLGESAFAGDTELTGVSLPDTLTEIGLTPFGDPSDSYYTHEFPEGLQLTVIKSSYAESWANENKIPYISVDPPTQEELLARRYPVLSVGSTGENVRRLQQALIDAGFLDDTADGSYGPNTAKAVAKAQETFGMEADGTASASFQARMYGEK